MREHYIEYRDNGAIGALLDEYERSINELKYSIQDITQEELTQIVDYDTEDEDCRSIQTILSHVVKAGYNYAVAIRKSLDESVEYKNSVSRDSIIKYNLALDNMFSYNERLFNDYPELKLEEFDCSNKIEVSWGQKYDVEQLFEHAIVHILRHRRQIERFLLKLR